MGEEAREVRGVRPECLALSVRSRKGQSITPDDVRLPLRMFIREATAAAVGRLGPDGSLTWEPGDVQSYFRGAVETERRDHEHNRYLGDDHYERVAEIYREALQLGYAPTKWVGVRFGKPRSTAARWVMEARERGKLGKAVGTRAGEV